VARRAATPFLDRPAARLAGIVVFLLCAGALAYVHRRDLWQAPGAAPVAACMHDRLAVIDGQLRDGVIKPEQAQLFRARVEALCAAQNRKAGPEGLPPAMTPAPLPPR
jgi:hypothetical protein